MSFDLDALLAPLGPDTLALLPECLLVVSIVVLLLGRLLPGLRRLHAGWLALPLLAGIIALAGWQWTEPMTQRTLFSGLLSFDRLALFLRLFLLVFAALTILLAMLSGLVNREDSADFCTLILGATFGMILMAASCHLLMLILAIEMASLPSYALVGYLRADRKAGEAALKYAVYGAGAIGVMLYGTSLVAGHYGTGSVPHLAVALAATVETTGTLPPIVLLGLAFLFVGIAFKLAAVPFHFWCPDVFEGASAEVAGFLSVASKAAAVTLLARLAFLFAGLDPLTADAEVGGWDRIVSGLLPALAILAAMTCTFGNLAAYRQMNIQRLLAYSTIAQAGYLMMGVATLTRAGLTAVLIYLVAYLLMNLGAFAVVAFLRRQMGSADLRDLRGLIRRAPTLTVLLAIFLLSLLGIPPLIGYFAKFSLFLAIYDAGQAHPGLAWWLYGLLIVAGLNMVLSAVYYLGVLRILILEQRAEDLEGIEPQPVAEPTGALAYTGVLALLVVGLIVAADPVTSASRSGTERYAEQSAP